MKIAIMGAGAWGVALGTVLSGNQHQLLFWGHDPQRLEEMKQTRASRYLPGIRLPESWSYVPDAREALAEAEAAVMAVPSKAFRQVAAHFAGYSRPIISVTKGIEYETGKTMTRVLASCAPRAQVAALSGPTFATEVAHGFPCAIVAASDDRTLAREVQELFHRATFRVYSSIDLTGVELGGALKNVIAIAAGFGDGLGFGDSSKAALVTRALAEIRRLGVAAGAMPETFAGLSGLGDLTVTCFSQLSRNRRFGEKLARGESVEGILAGTGSVEGYPTARSAYQLARNLGAETPIIDEVYAVLYAGKNIADSLRDLTTRSSKSED